MKMTMDVECTPEEARRVMGLPDLTPIHDAYLEKMRKLVEDGITPDTMESMMRAWAPMGDTGMAMWRQLMDRMTGSMSKS
ncbi:DUF6489 family protein [Sphingomonas naphthae]|uniref:DUF6489 family protein n=1 Tax=Sphingomonas naphthae TaxID=1813468 RepID=A0ABY7TJ67_9SPHN|nr:DUF6489 family protein [Sphingomonas naphthae]WCT73276.1 DUF6489 family protein [Sphingomonas naphthae]